jgi:hypothetical protein
MNNTEVAEVYLGGIMLNDQGDIVLSLVVVDREGRRWVGFAVGPSDDIEEVSKRAIVSALKLRSLHIGAQSAPREEVREAPRETLPRETPPSSYPEASEDEGKKREALKYLRALWMELKKRGIDPAELTGRSNVEDFQDLPLEELRKVYKLLHGALK